MSTSRRDLAHAEIEADRRDPRIDRGRGAMIADFHAAMEEAERVRQLGVWGLVEVRQAVERLEQRLGVRRGDPNLTPAQAAEFDAALQRARLAAAEMDNEHPHLHATALISMHSALDALVEELVPGAQQMFAHVRVEQFISGLEGDMRHTYESLDAELRERIKKVFAEQLASQFPKAGRPRGVGVRRYERLLAKAGLQASPDRPIPQDLDEALAELGALRDVLVHRAGRVDSKALSEAPSLPYEDGQFVRLSRSDYRKYSAALRCYGAEIIRRLMRDLAEEVDLGTWRDWYRINA